MKKRTGILFLSLIILILLINPASGDPIIDIRLEVYEDDIVNEQWFHFTEGMPIDYHQGGGAYNLTLLDNVNNIIFNQPIHIRFKYYGAVESLDTDYSGLDTDLNILDYQIPYNPNMRELRLYHGNNIIFSKVLNFCNNNDVCDSSETFESCPADCPLNRNDIICIPDEDGFCDPDCGQGVDPDCGNQFYPFAGEDKQVKAGTPVSFSGEVRNAGSGTYTYSWYFEEDGSTKTGREVTHTFAENGVFAVTLTVTNQNGVHKEDTLLVTVSGLGCEITDGVCDGVTVFKIQNLDNGHAQLQGSYPYSVCCGGVSGLGTENTGTAVLGFAEQDNSHVQKNSVGTYLYKAYLSAPSGITCDYIEGSGDGYTVCEGVDFDTCLASIQNEDNSHIGNCDAYNQKICCKVGGEESF